MTKKNSDDNKIRKRWGTEVAAAGWTAIPNILLERQQALRLDSVDLNILLVLAKHWWEAEKKPYPSKKRISEIIGRTPDTTRKHIKVMEDKGLIKRVKRFKNTSDGGGQTSNEYDLSGLVEMLDEFAKQDLEDAREVEDDKARKRRGNV